MVDHDQVSALSDSDSESGSPAQIPARPAQQTQPTQPVPILAHPGLERENTESQRHAPNSRQPVLRFWAAEILLIAVSIGLIVAILVILLQQDGRPIQEWGLAINLSSLAAILSTFLRAAMVAVATEIVSQAKWTWFWQSSSAGGRPLRDLQRFDSGSRSIWGAMLLLPTVAVRSPSTLLASIILIVSVAVGPFVQQAILTVEKSFPAPVVGGDMASLPISRYVNGSDMYFRTRTGALLVWWELTPRVRAEMVNSFIGLTADVLDAAGFCATGNCSFPSIEAVREAESVEEATHASVGLCSRCVEVTSLAKFSSNKTAGNSQVKLPNGLTLIDFDSQAYLQVAVESNFTWAKELLTPDDEAAFRWPLAVVTVLTRTRVGMENWDGNQNDGREYVAGSCSLHPCLRTYSAQFRDAQLSEKLVHTTPMEIDVGDMKDEDLGREMPDVISDRMIFMQRANYTAVQSPCRVGETIYTTANMSTFASGIPVRIPKPGTPNITTDTSVTTVPEECLYRMSAGYVPQLLATYFEKELFKGNCSWDSRQGRYAECGDNWWLGQFWEKQNATFKSIESRFEDFTTAATNYFRLGTGSGDQEPAKVRGIAYRSIPITVIEWRWLLMPAGLLVIELAVLVYVIVQSWRNRGREMVWKSNILPLMYYRDLFFGRGNGIGPASNGITPDRHRLMTTGEMEKDADGVMVGNLAEQQFASQLSGQTEYKPGTRRDGDWDSLLLNPEHR